MSRPLPSSFFCRPTLRVAQHLLGRTLVKREGRAKKSVRIVDVEAYIGEEDQACHARRGRTPRTEVMFGPPGVAYVYLIYGMHHCLNVVTEKEGAPAAILIRGVEDTSPPTPLRINGPGRVCRFLDIDRSFNGMKITTGKSLWVEEGEVELNPRDIHRVPRVGVDYAGDWAHRPWRLFIAP